MINANRIAVASPIPGGDFQKELLYASVLLNPPMSRTSRPLPTVNIAAYRNHQRARHVSLSKAVLRADGSISAYAGVWTKLKNQSSPIHITANITWAIRIPPQSP